MLETSPTRAVCLAKLSHRLQSECYGRPAVSNYPSCADRFLDYLERKGLTVYSVQPTEVDRYLPGPEGAAQHPSRGNSYAGAALSRTVATGAGAGE